MVTIIVTIPLGLCPWGSLSARSHSAARRERNAAHEETSTYHLFCYFFISQILPFLIQFFFFSSFPPCSISLLLNSIYFSRFTHFLFSLLFFFLNMWYWYFWCFFKYIKINNLFIVINSIYFYFFINSFTFLRRMSMQQQRSRDSGQRHRKGVAKTI